MIGKNKRVVTQIKNEVQPFLCPQIAMRIPLTYHVAIVLEI